MNIIRYVSGKEIDEKKLPYITIKNESVIKTINNVNERVFSSSYNVNEKPDERGR